MNLFGMKKHHLKALWIWALLDNVLSGGSRAKRNSDRSVSDEKGELLIGVSVQEKDTGNGTITDINGQYTLKLTTANPTLVISYVDTNRRKSP